MRIIGGSAKGRRLAGPPRGTATRPTSDKVRQAIFNILGDAVRGARVVDLFAGTGALGIEALSRGAAHVIFVEAEGSLCKTINANLATVGFSDRATVLCRDVRRAVAALPPGSVDLAFVDPPYGLGLDREALDALVRARALAPGALVVLEHARRQAPPEAPLGLELAWTRPYGDTSVTCYIAGSASVTSSEPQQGTPEPPRSPDAPGAAMNRIAIYPGSFDPLTNGHYDVIQRSLALFDRLVIAVASNIRKQPLFPLDERIALIREIVGPDPRIEVDTFEGLLVEYAKTKGAVALVRGLRAVADFEYEFEMASMNRRLAPNVETVFLMTHENYFYVSSHLVKEVAALGGDITAFVPPLVAERLKGRFTKQ